MTTISLPLRTLSPLAAGLILTGGLAALAFALRMVPVFSMFSPLILAVLLGAAWRNTVGLPAVAVPGMQFALRRLLRLGIVLLGLQLTLADVAEVGATGLGTIVFVLGSTFFFTLWAGRRLGVEPGLAQLIAAGTSICGASAVIAANTVTRAEEEDVAYAIAGVTLFGTLAMLAFPPLGAAMGLAARDYGLWVGASIHEVAQVVAAGGQGGEEAGAFATIAKLTRVALLAPMILLMARAAKGDGGSARAPFPWFVLGFLAMVLLASSGLVPEVLTQAAVPVTQGLLTIALAAMGLQTDFGRLRAKGLRPLALGAVASVFIAGLTLLLVIGASWL